MLQCRLRTNGRYIAHYPSKVFTTLSLRLFVSFVVCRNRPKTWYSTKSSCIRSAIPLKLLWVRCTAWAWQYLLAPAHALMQKCTVIPALSSLTEQEAPMTLKACLMPTVRASLSRIITCCNSLSVQVLPIDSTNRLIVTLMPPFGSPRRFQDHPNCLLVVQRLLKGPYAGTKSAVLFQ